MHDNNKNIHSSITEPNTSDSVKSMEKANAYYDYFSRHTLPSYKEAAAAEKEKRRVLKEKKTEKGNVDIVEDIQLKQSTSDQDSSLMQDQVKTDVSPVRKETNNDDLLTNMNISETDLLNSFEDIDQFLMKNNSSSQMFDGGVFDVNTIIGDLNNNTRSGMATGSAGTSLFEEVALNNTPSKGTKRLSEDASSLEQSSVKHIKTSHEVVDISDIIDMIPQTKIPTFSYQPSLPSIHSHREQKKVSTPSNLLPWSPIHSNGEKKKVPTPSYQPSLSPAHSIGEQKKVPTPSYYPSHAVILSDGEQTQPTPAPTCVFVPSGATSTVSASDNESVPRTRETNPSNKASLHTVIRSQEAFRSTIDITPVPVSSRPLKDLTSPPVNQALRNTRNIPSPTLDPSSSNAKGVRKFPESDTDFLTDLLAKVNEDSKKRLPLPPPISALPCKLLPGFPHPLPPTLEQAGHDENSSSSRGDINVKTKKKIGKRNRIKKNKKKAQKMIENINKKNIDDLDFDALLNYHEKATKQPDTESVSTNNDGGVIAARNSEEKIPFANNKRRLDENEAPTEVSDVAPKNPVKKQKKTHKPQHTNNNTQAGHTHTSPKRDNARAQRQERQPQGQSNKEKTLPCRFFIKGFCKDGDACKFKHEGEQEIEVCLYFKTNSCFKGEDCPFSHNLKQEPCRFYHLKKRCEQGKECPYSHEELTPVLRTRLHKLTGPCRFYHFKGYCNTGENCPFSHSEISEEEKKKLEATIEPCQFYHLRGTCRMGDECFYLHDEASPEQIAKIKRH